MVSISGNIGKINIITPLDMEKLSLGKVPFQIFLLIHLVRRKSRF